MVPDRVLALTSVELGAEADAATDDATARVGDVS